MYAGKKGENIEESVLIGLVEEGTTGHSNAKSVSLFFSICFALFSSVFLSSYLSPSSAVSVCCRSSPYRRTWWWRRRRREHCPRRRRWWHAAPSGWCCCLVGRGVEKKVIRKVRTLLKINNGKGYLLPWKTYWESCTQWTRSPSRRPEWRRPTRERGTWSWSLAFWLNDKFYVRTFLVKTLTNLLTYWGRQCPWRWRPAWSTRRRPPCTGRCTWRRASPGREVAASWPPIPGPSSRCSHYGGRPSPDRRASGRQRALTAPVREAATEQDGPVVAPIRGRPPSTAAVHHCWRLKKCQQSPKRSPETSLLRLK